jgi:pimeloyl-ACP methyl ester carboxylesterase
MVARQLERDGAVIHYEVTGPTSAATPLVLTHGFSSSTAMWAPNLGALAEDRQVVTWDLRGHGRTHAGRDPASYSHGACVDDLVAILDACDITFAAFGGLSLGGYLSLCFHLAHPDRVAALLLCDCGPGFRSDLRRAAWNEYAETTARALERDGAGTLAGGREAGLGAQDPAALALAARGILSQHDASVIESLDDIGVPTLVLVGERDVGFRTASDYMAAHIRGAKLFVIPGAGHAANMDEPAAFNEAVREFLAAIR